MLVEQEARGTTGITRSQNAVFVLPHDWTSISQILRPLLDRVEENARELQLLIIASDAEVAAAVIAAAVKLTAGRDVGLIAATSARRAARLIKIKPPHVLAGAPDTLVELLKSASVKLDAVRVVCIAWADELLTNGAGASLETIMTEVPKESARTIVTAELTPAVDEVLERYARRALRHATAEVEGDQPIAVEYVSTSARVRLSALRRLLDESDPQSAVVFVRDSESEAEVSSLLRTLGYVGKDAPVRTGLTASPGTEMVVLFDLPVSRAELREAATGAKRVVALIQPRQLTSLRAMTTGSSLKPLTLTEAGVRARSREARMREELRAALSAGQYGRELLALEPLLDDFDCVEIAAAALQLLDRERADRAASATAVASAPRPREVGTMVPLFVNVGSRDGARPADIVGSIASQPGVTGGDVGRVDVRESHTVVEVSAGVADSVIEHLTGSTIRGRRAIARRDEGRQPKREGAERGRDSGGRGRPPSSRPRDAKRGPRDDSRERRGPPPSRRSRDD
jgi:ATP-dependent RNA helicase DeaD